MFDTFYGEGFGSGSLCRVNLFGRCWAGLCFRLARTQCISILCGLDVFGCPLAVFHTWDNFATEIGNLCFLTACNLESLLALVDKIRVIAVFHRASFSK